MRFYQCCRQQAGNLTKECRYRLAPFSDTDTAEERRDKAALKDQRRCAVNRRPADRLELLLALMHEGWMHTLTFDNDHLPHNFREVRVALRAFIARARRWRASLDKPDAFDYIYAVEGLHGQRRYHIHLVTDYYELGPAEVRLLWRQGFVDSEPVLKKDGKGYRTIAEYLNKERTDGVMIPIGRHPFSASRSLSGRLAPPEKWRDPSGVIVVPEGAACVRVRHYDFGAAGDIHYASWLQS